MPQLKIKICHYRRRPRITWEPFTKWATVHYSNVETLSQCRMCCKTCVLISVVDCFWNVMAHAQNTDFVFRRNGRVHLNRRGRQFGQLLAAEMCASAVVMLDTPCSGVVWRVLATHSIRQFPLHFPSRASPCAITFQLDSTVFDRINHAEYLNVFLWQSLYNTLNGNANYVTWQWISKES
jgi:hypothetical protein